MVRPRSGAGIELVGRLVAGVGIASALTGTAAWLTVRSQLAAERIQIPAAARWLPGQRVTGPVTAMAQADAIRRTAAAATGGRTYGELPEDDPLAELALNASLLRASLFTSVLAFGVAAAQMGIGAVLVVIGAALTSAGRRLPVG